MASDSRLWCRWFGPLLCGSLFWGTPGLTAPDEPLTRAEVYKVVNRVELIPQHQPPRPARTTDVLAPLDSLATRTQSRADLLFNEGSLARIGGNSLFRFEPGTRNFQLDSGTTIVMFPPGSLGGTITTPNATVEANGSIVWVKQDAVTQATFIGALTAGATSSTQATPVVVVVEESGDRVELQMGERLTLRPGQPPEVKLLHLPTFHAACKLAAGLGPGEADALEQEMPEVRATLQATRTDTMQALKQQDGISAKHPATAALCQETTAIEETAISNAQWQTGSFYS